MINQSIYCTFAFTDLNFSYFTVIDYFYDFLLLLFCGHLYDENNTSLFYSLKRISNMNLFCYSEFMSVVLGRKCFLHYLLQFISEFIVYFQWSVVCCFLMQASTLPEFQVVQSFGLWRRRQHQLGAERNRQTRSSCTGLIWLY